MSKIAGFEDNRQSVCPRFSVCIPQYNRTEFLIKALETYRSQTFEDFEVCISDDCSTDGKTEYLLRYLRESGLHYVYSRMPKNGRYDANLRNAIALSRGSYLWLMGNDDGFSDPGALAAVNEELTRHGSIAAAITNFCDAVSGRPSRRVTATRMLGAGPDVAVSTFRLYSFVSGVLLDGPAARACATDRYDGTEMYQMYLATRLVAAGGRLLLIDRVCVAKDLHIPGHSVDSYRKRQREPFWPIRERVLPMRRLLEVVSGGLKDSRADGDRERQITSAALQLYTFTYPYWIIEYRKVQSFSYAIGVALGLRPSRVAGHVRLPLGSRCRLMLRFALFGAAALFTPVGLFERVESGLYAFAKRTKLQ